MKLAELIEKLSGIQEMFDEAGVESPDVHVHNTEGGDWTFVTAVVREDMADIFDTRIVTIEGNNI